METIIKEKAIDPVCGMAVDTDTEFISFYKRKTYYFCSAEDKAEFDRHPDDYALKARWGLHKNGHGAPK